MPIRPRRELVPVRARRQRVLVLELARVAALTLPASQLVVPAWERAPPQPPALAARLRAAEEKQSAQSQAPRSAASREFSQLAVA